MTEMTTWASETTARIGEQIRLHRQGRPAMWLADRTAELGHPISRTAISEYETGKRKAISVTDLVTIAAALEIPPVTLIYPHLPDGPVEVLPSVQSTSIAAAQWFSGQGPNPSGENVYTARISKAREYVDLQSRRDRVAVDATLASQDGSAGPFGTLEEAQRALRLITERLETVVELMRANPDEWTVRDA